jgi:hypothetical protein
MVNEEIIDLIKIIIEGCFGFIFLELQVGSSFVLQDTGPKVFVRGENGKQFVIT